MNMMDRFSLVYKGVDTWATLRCRVCTGSACLQGSKGGTCRWDLASSALEAIHFSSTVVHDTVTRSATSCSGMDRHF